MKNTIIFGIIGVIVALITALGINWLATTIFGNYPIYINIPISFICGFVFTGIGLVMGDKYDDRI